MNFTVDELINQYVIGVNQCDRVVEWGYIGDGIYVNLNGRAGSITVNDENWLHDIAKHIEELLNRDVDDGMEWVLYSETNYWNLNGGNHEVDEIDEADIIQWMIYEEEK